MQRQVEAERSKRAKILESEGVKQAAINEAEGEAEALLINARAKVHFYIRLLHHPVIRLLR